MNCTRTACRIPYTYSAPHITSGKRIYFVDYSSDDVHLPDTRLLRLYTACSKFLDMSGATEYIEKLIPDSEERAVKGTLDTGGAAIVHVSMFEGLGVICGEVR